ncbi:uncharacterized protein RBU33_004500 isoform 1-T1 [Hipposideros larvatus]
MTLWSPSDTRVIPSRQGTEKTPADLLRDRVCSPGWCLPQSSTSGYSLHPKNPHAPGPDLAATPDAQAVLTASSTFTGSSPQLVAGSALWDVQSPLQEAHSVGSYTVSESFRVWHGGSLLCDKQSCPVPTTAEQASSERGWGQEHLRSLPLP